MTNFSILFFILQGLVFIVYRCVLGQCLYVLLERNRLIAYIKYK